jgi:16S rRNA (uracil1498-N3)-methyltransferase
MHRVLIDAIPNGESIVISDPNQVHHIKDVLRLTSDEKITVFDGRGGECQCTIHQLKPKSVILEITTRKEAKLRKVKLTVACALPKKGLDDIIDKLTQLGVSRIIPMLTERVVVRIEERNLQTRLNRWQRLARVAAEQSQRSDVPEVQTITEFGDIISRAETYDLKLIPNLTGDRKSLNQIVPGKSFSSILILIGPEGDFTQQEVEAAIRSGFIPVSLGDLVLRVDTAAVAVASYIRMATE